MTESSFSEQREILSAPRSREIHGLVSRIFHALLLPILFLIVWQLTAIYGWLPDYLVPPSVIVVSLWKLFVTGEIWEHLDASLWRAVTGFIIGFGAGVFWGLLAGTRRFVDIFFDPLVSFTYPVPKIVIFPILMAWLGIGDASKIFIIATAVFYPAFLNTYYGAKAVERSHLWAARNMGASPARIFLRVVLPSALPQILTGARISMAITFVVLFAAEMVGARSGLGYLVVTAENSMRLDLMFAAILAIGLIGTAADRLLLALRKRLLVGRAELRQ